MGKCPPCDSGPRELPKRIPKSLPERCTWENQPHSKLEVTHPTKTGRGPPTSTKPECASFQKIEPSNEPIEWKFWEEINC